MDIAKDLARIDGLRAREIPAEPGYHQAVLGPRDWPSEEDCYAYEAALAELLTARWGEPARWGTTTLVEHGARGGRIAEAWALLTVFATELRTWEVEGTWVVLTVLDREKEEMPKVFVLITREDPP
ncbi:hypothetical protein BN159_7326 [Streptomyces davaonensis JCM 4913]|uniref:Uncharacterized protein n=1 Tax=Streptomyces davaonensis (strain DSM 101723 / JCM 4913 / KCC S-0913 / 768) TaxID=1214101 RepID=K4RE16_STRDJ|nr:hypothetical protein [Streptomyces davaonensis]CCK31705.1 hypothetical protein BN159_7326 [Streptomyces davaonensis JCM 4913]